MTIRERRAARGRASRLWATVAVMALAACGEPPSAELAQAEAERTPRGDAVTAVTPVPSDEPSDDVAFMPESRQTGETDAPLPSPSQASARESEMERCLSLIWAAQGRQDNDFDRVNDTIVGGSIACNMGTSATAVSNGLKAIRAAALSADPRQMATVIRFPLQFIDAAGNRRTIPNEAQLRGQFETVFDRQVLRRLSRIGIQEMEIVGSEGAMFDLGGIWIAVAEQGGQPKLITINKQAIGEARGLNEEAAGTPRPTPSATPR